MHKNYNKSMSIIRLGVEHICYYHIIHAEFEVGTSVNMFIQCVESSIDQLFAFIVLVVHEFMHCFW